MDGLENGDPLDEATNLESTFYAQGYTSGHAHGRLHGLFEGRELGSEKGFEIWEEVGYYEGWAGFWVDNLESEGKQRAMGHAKQLLHLISTFPTTNPTPIEIKYEPTPWPSIAHLQEGDANSSPQNPMDLAALLSQIRARYRLLCASLGVRPRLMASKDKRSVDDSAGEGGGGAVEGIEGPMKGVDTKKLLF